MSTAFEILWSLLTFIVAYRLGVVHERIAWNKLIEQGKIPKPKEG